MWILSRVTPFIKIILIRPYNNFENTFRIGITIPWHRKEKNQCQKEKKIPLNFDNFLFHVVTASFRLTWHPIERHLGGHLNLFSLTGYHLLDTHSLKLPSLIRGDWYLLHRRSLRMESFGNPPGYFCLIICINQPQSV